MENSAFASFKWSTNELLVANRIHLRHSRIGRYIRRSMLTVGPFVLLVGTSTLVTRGFHPMGVFFILMSTALLFFPLLNRQILLKHYSRRPDRDMLVHWEFHSEGITSKTEASSARFEWRMITRVLQTDEGFLLYPNDYVFHWIPVHAFVDAANVDAFLSLAKSKVAQFDQRK